jgi:hypothetical protein
LPVNHKQILGSAQSQLIAEIHAALTDHWSYIMKAYLPCRAKEIEIGPYQPNAVDLDSIRPDNATCHVLFAIQGKITESLIGIPL